MILIDGNESEMAAIRHALIAASADDRISRRDPPQTPKTTRELEQ
jgi:hypothetical protein